MLSNVKQFACFVFRMPEDAYAKIRRSKNVKNARMGIRAYGGTPTWGKVEGNFSKKVEKIHFGRGQVCVEIKKTLALKRKCCSFHMGENTNVSLFQRQAIEHTARF